LVAGCSGQEREEKTAGCQKKRGGEEQREATERNEDPNDL